MNVPSPAAQWNKRLERVRVTLMKWAIDMEIDSRSASPTGSALYRTASESIRHCFLLLEDSLEGLPEYTKDIYGKKP